MNDEIKNSLDAETLNDQLMADPLSIIDIDLKEHSSADQALISKIAKAIMKSEKKIDDLILEKKMIAQGPKINQDTSSFVKQVKKVADKETVGFIDNTDRAQFASDTAAANIAVLDLTQLRAKAHKIRLQKVAFKGVFGKFTNFYE